jgi:hypothetical protein
LDTLTKNKAFKALIREGYLKNEAVRLVHLKAAPAMQSPEMQENIIRDINGIGSLIGYLHKIEVQADMAAQAINADEETLEELRREESA